MPAIETKERTTNGEVSMRDFYQSFGLSNYPFNIFTAENETKYAGSLFVHPLNYDEIKGSFDGNRSVIIRGNRGTGKTALLLDLQQSRKENDLFCIIDDYSELQMSPGTLEYYTLLIKSLVAELFFKLFDEKHRIKKLSREEKLFLSALLSEYTDQITKDELVGKIKKIQLPKPIRFFKKISGFLTTLLNYGVSAASNIVNDMIRIHYYSLPPIQESQIRELIPKLNIDVETEFNISEASYKLLLQICSLTQKLGYNKIAFFLDKFDEDGRMENNAETISEFIKSLVTDNKLLETPNIQIVISVWEVPFLRLLPIVRTQKHHCPVLAWSIPKLKDALNVRIKVFSENKLNNFQDLFSSNVDPLSIDSIFNLCNGNPRDLWHILNYIFQAQYTIDPNTNKLTEEAIVDGLKNFVVKFNFYEYYPRKANAKANTMDIYSYIKYLLKLCGPTFTKNQLNEAAKIGSSLHNYVVGMESIGLIVNTNEKINGGVVYKINDPKVVYAIENNLDISKQ